MSPDKNKSLIKDALKSLKAGDVAAAKNLMGIQSNQLSDDNFTDGMRSLEKGISLLIKGHHPQAVEPLRKALPIVNLSSDDEAKFFVSVLADFADGISKLLSGDAHTAVSLLNLSTDAIERLNFFIPGFEKLALSFKAAAQTALTRTFLNSGNISEAEACIGIVNNIYAELFELLNESNVEDIPLLAEIFSSRLESSILLMSFDLAALDFDSLKLRLESAKNNYHELIKILPKVPQSPIKSAFEIICILYTVYNVFSSIGKRIIIERKPLTKTEIEELTHIDQKLFEARQIANGSGERGRVFLFSINQLSKLQERFLGIGKVRKNDFGRLSGFLALGALVAQVIVVHFTIHPTGSNALLFFLGEIIISLIVGFGYEAIKFKPLIGLYLDALKAKTDKA